MTLLEHPVSAPPCAGALAAALAVAGPPGSLLLIGLDGPATPAAAADAAAALRRETRGADWVGAAGDDVAVVLDVLPADLDAVADRLLSVVERATGRTASGGLVRPAPDRSADDLLARARVGLDVAWACGGSRVVRHP